MILTKPTVKLLHSTPVWVSAHAIRECHSSHDKSDTGICPQCETDAYGYTLDLMDTAECNKCGTFFNIVVCGPKDFALINRVGLKLKHESSLEHINITFSISNISRALLQEFARTRIGIALTVKSSRYTLNELSNESQFHTNISDHEYHISNENFTRAYKYIVESDNDDVNRFNIIALDNLRKLVKSGASNDVTKYVIPEAYKTSLTATFNIRSLRHLYLLRTAPSALQEYRELCKSMFDVMEPQHQKLVQDCIYQFKQKEK